MSHNFDCDSNNDYYNLPAGWYFKNYISWHFGTSSDYFFFDYLGVAITAIDYDETGDYLATGSRSGKISILKVDNSSNKCRVY